jgi:hypothetical protein
VASFGIVEQKSKNSLTKLLLVQVGDGAGGKCGNVQCRKIRDSREIEVDGRKHYNYDLFKYLKSDDIFERILKCVKTSFEVNNNVSFTNGVSKVNVVK